MRNVYDNHDLAPERRYVVGGGSGYSSKYAMESVPSTSPFLSGGIGRSWSVALEDPTLTRPNSSTCYLNATGSVPSTSPFLSGGNGGNWSTALEDPTLTWPDSGTCYSNATGLMPSTSPFLNGGSGGNWSAASEDPTLTRPNSSSCYLNATGSVPSTSTFLNGRSGGNWSAALEDPTLTRPNSSTSYPNAMGSVPSTSPFLNGGSGENWSAALEDTTLTRSNSSSSYPNAMGSVPSTSPFLKGGSGGNWSAASEALTLTRPNSSTCYSNAMESVPSTSPFFNVSSNVPSTSYPPQDDEVQLQIQLEEQQKLPNEFVEKFLEKANNLIKDYSSYNTQSLSSESDEDEILSSEINGVQTHSESSVVIREWKHKVNSHVPEIGRKFLSEEEAYKFYKRYAGKMGFKVRKGKVQRSSSDGTITKRDLFCSREGFRLKKQSNKMTKYKRIETRTGCNAKMQITFENGKWVISSFHSEHNHDLESSIQKQTRNSCINISETHSTIQPMHEIRMAKEGKAAECVGFCEKNYDNYLHDKKMNSLQPEDVQGFINYLKHLQLEDPSFFYTVQVDAETHLTNFFWRDGRSKIDYDYFRDVLILDTTFRMEKSNMICAPFLGLNHHRQYVLFGCAFLLDETMESFIWLLGTFIEAMSGRHPKTIFTNECQAIAKAVEILLPKTEHCLHIQFLRRNAAQKLSSYYGQPEFESLFKRFLFDCQSKEEFESVWVTMLDLYNLHENLWLQNLYMLREKWSFAFSKMTFSAGIQSEQGSEKINDVFQNMRSKTMTLLEYVQQYEKAAEQQRREYEDLRSNVSEPVIILKSSVMEKQAANVYTHATFKIFQEELLRCLSVALEEIGSDGTTAKFRLTEEGHKKENFVTFNCADSTISCSCKMFESIGILCVHALKVLNTRNIFEIPPQYILKRWTKAAKDGMVVDDDGEGIAEKSDRPLSLCMSKLMHKALNVITKSLPVEEGRKLVDRQLDITWKMLQDVLKTKGIEVLNGIHQESSGGCSHSYSLGDNSLQFSNDHPRALTSFKSTVHQNEDPSMPTAHIEKAADNLDEAIERLVRVENQMKLAGNVAGTKKVTELLQLGFKAHAQKILVDQKQQELLSKRSVKIPLLGGSPRFTKIRFWNGY